MGLTDQDLRSGYHRAQHLDPWEGCYLGSDCPFAPGPRYDGTAVLAGAKVAKERGFIDEYRWNFGMYDTAIALGFHGPAILGVWWKAGMERPDEAGFIWPTGARRGGHAVCARAVKIVRFDHHQPFTWDNTDLDKSYVTIRNSWGRGWGVDGDCYMTLRALDDLLAEQGESCVFMKRTQP